MTDSHWRVKVTASWVVAVTMSLVFSPAPQFKDDGLPKASRSRPSVLLVTLDTVRADHLRCYGYSRIETPNLDGLAAEGVRFTNAYTQAPITLPAHAVILTGTYPMYNAVRDFTSVGLPGSVPTLAEKLRREGYHTAAFVSSFVLNSMWGLNRGFEVYDDAALDAGVKNSPFLLARRGDVTTDRLLDWIASKGREPFFAWVHLYDAHSPYRSPEPYRRRYPHRPYDGAVAFDDAQIGRVIARLRALELYDSTAIVVLSDHGESLGEHGESEHGFFVYNATLQVPLILKLPGETAKARVVSQPVATLDVAPTIAEICKLPSADFASFQGQSLLRSMDESPFKPPEEVYAESYYPRDSFGWHELRALVTPNFKYIEAPRQELYDLRRDPGERVNIIATHSDLASSLRDRLSAFDSKFAAQGAPSSIASLDPEVLEKLKSLGYIGYKAATLDRVPDAQRADPKDKIATLNQVLRAADLTRLRQYADADRLLSRLERDEGTLYVVPFEKGENEMAWGKPQPAAGEFRKALALNPTFDQAALGLGRAYFLLGQDSQATTAFELALRLNPRNFLARVALAKAYWRRDLLEKAEPELDQVVEAHPEFTEARADHGIVLAKLRKYREAAAEIQRALESGYRDATAYNYLGIAHAELGDAAQAMRDYQQAVALNPRYAAAYLNLALQYRKQGQPTKAQSCYKKVCELSDALCRQYASQF